MSLLAGVTSSALLTRAIERQARTREERRERKQNLDKLIAAFETPTPVADRDASANRGDRALEVARLLRPENLVVSFWPRPELGQLLDWCATKAPAAVSLVTGEGGAGKTRLALQVCEELTATGSWHSLWVPRGLESVAVGVATGTGQSCVLVVDYAETRDRGSLAGLLADVAQEQNGLADEAQEQNGRRIRVVILARSKGEWWKHLVANAENQVNDLLAKAWPVHVGPVTSEGSQGMLFDEALTAFVEKLGVSRPEAKLRLTEQNAVVLVVHAAALLAALDSDMGSINDQPESGPDALSGIIQHEARYWARSAASSGLNLDQSVLRLTVAVGCLIGAKDEADASKLLACIPDLADSAERRLQAARWAHDLYPADQAAGNGSNGEWIAPLRPDPVADRLIVSELSDRHDIISRLFKGIDKKRAARAFTVLARAALTQPDAHDLLRAAQAAFDGSMVFGTSVTIPAAQVAKVLVGAPGGIGSDFTGGDLILDGSLQPGPDVAANALLLRIPPEPPVRQLLRLNVTSRSVGPAGRLRIEAQDDAGLLKLDLRMNTAKGEYQACLRYMLLPEVLPLDAVPVLRFGQALAADERMAFTDLSGKVFGAGSGMFGPSDWPANYVRCAKALAEIQELAGAFFPLPSAFTLEDQHNIDYARTLLRGEDAHITWSGATAWLDCGAIRSLLERINGADKDFSLLCRTQETVKIGSGQVLLGWVMQTAHSARITNLEDVLAWYRGRTDGRIEIRLGPANTNQMTVRPTPDEPIGEG